MCPWSKKESPEGLPQFAPMDRSARASKLETPLRTIFVCKFCILAIDSKSNRGGRNKLGSAVLKLPLFAADDRRVLNVLTRSNAAETAHEPASTFVASALGSGQRINCAEDSEAFASRQAHPTAR